MKQVTQNARRTIGPYKVIKSLSFGTFSEVVLVARKGEFFACKIISRKSIVGYEESFKNEILIHKMMHHPNVVELIDLLMDEDNFYLIIEHCSHGDLCEFLARHGCIPEKTVKMIAKQLIMAADYIHSKNVTHRDIKPENLMIDSFSHVKLTDFGLSDFFDTDNNDMVTNSCGSIIYASPECLSGQPYNGRSTDAWSCGVTIYTLITGRSPWKGQDEESITEEIFTTEIRLPRFLTPMCCDFLTRLLERDWRKRMTIEEALKHPWIDGSSFPANRSRGSVDIRNQSASIFKNPATFSIQTSSTEKVPPNSNNEEENRRNHIEVSRSVITEEKLRLFLETVKKVNDESEVHLSCDNFHENSKNSERKVKLVVENQIQAPGTPKAIHTSSGISSLMNSITWK